MHEDKTNWLSWWLVHSVSLPFPIFHASDPVTRMDCWNWLYDSAELLRLAQCIPAISSFSCIRPGDLGKLLEQTHCMIGQNQSDLYSVSVPFPAFHASNPVTRANCWNWYIVRFSRTTGTCTVYSSWNAYGRLGCLVSLVASLGSYCHVYVFTHIGLALGIVQAFTGGFLVVMHDDKINWPSQCLVHYLHHFQFFIRLTWANCLNSMIRQNWLDLYSVSLPFPAFHASDPVTQVNCWNRYIVRLCRTTWMCTVYSSWNTYGRLGSLVSSVASLGHTTVYLHILD
jgi:hypothetical protein